MNDVTTSLNGTIADVASFFRVSVRSVQQWQKLKKIGFWKDGRNVIFGEESIVELRAAGYVASRRLEPGEASARARREWREHLKIRRSEETAERLSIVEDRLAQLEILLRKEAA